MQESGTQINHEITNVEALLTEEEGKKTTHEMQLEVHLFRAPDLKFIGLEDVYGCNQGFLLNLVLMLTAFQDW